MTIRTPIQSANPILLKQASSPMPQKPPFMSAADVRRAFLEFFRERGHTVVPSSSLVPGNDPTLLFTNAGMVQFKDCFLGKDKRDYVRATSSQRCVRAGGKHNDLENVGYTARHHTFFEMLGNFSFGDYFKKDAIRFALGLRHRRRCRSTPRVSWSRCTPPTTRRSTSGTRMIGLPADKIVRIGDKPGGGSDNFWQMGETGPCGPCTRNLLRSRRADSGRPAGLARRRRRSLGRDLEPRVHAVRPLGRRQAHAAAEAVRGHGRGARARVRGDAGRHQQLRHRSLQEPRRRPRPRSRTPPTSPTAACASSRITSAPARFLIIDGVMPSNEGRGYVLRRIIRRAIRHGYKLGIKDAFFYKLVATLAQEMGGAFPELVYRQGARRARAHARKASVSRETLANGMQMLDAAFAKLKGGKTLDGEHGLQALRHLRLSGRPHRGHRARARPHHRPRGLRSARWKCSASSRRPRASSAWTCRAASRLDDKTEFLGYEAVTDVGKVVALLKGGAAVQTL